LCAVSKRIPEEHDTWSALGWKSERASRSIGLFFLAELCTSLSLFLFFSAGEKKKKNELVQKFSQKGLIHPR